MADVVLCGARGYRVPPPCWAGLVSLPIDRGWRPSPASVSRRAGVLWEAVLDRVTDADAQKRALGEGPDHRGLPRQAYRVVGAGQSAAVALLIGSSLPSPRKCPPRAARHFGRASPDPCRWRHVVYTSAYGTPGSPRLTKAPQK
jgi:hypothetical protein